MTRALVIGLTAFLLLTLPGAPAWAVTGLVSNGGNNLGPTDQWNLAIGVTHTGATEVVDVYLIIVVPGGTPVFLTVGPGGVSVSPTPAPLATGVTLTNGVNTGLLPLLSYALTGAEPTGLYQVILAFTTTGTTSVVQATTQPFFVMHVPVSQVLGTYTGSWTNQTFGSTGSAGIQILDTAAGVITVSAQLGGNVFGAGPTSFTLPVNLQAGNTVSAATAFGPLTATVSQNLGIQGGIAFNPGGPISAMTFTGSLASGVIHVNYTVSFNSGLTAIGILDATR